VKTLLLLLLAGKLGKFLLSAGSMLISIGTYTLLYGWRYAVGFVGLLFVHELGHYLAAQQRGLNVGLPTFIPFFGAWIELKEQPMNAETEAFVGLAGPMLGSAAAFALYLIAQETNSNMVLALSYAGFMLNLFNLIPLSPLDGGRIVGVISPQIWFVGIPILLGVFFWRPSPMLLIVALLAAPHLWAAYQNRNNISPDYYNADSATRFKYGFQYLALTLFLAVSAFETHEALAIVRGHI
jgi:Zn-dependent protease